MACFAGFTIRWVVLGSLLPLAIEQAGLSRERLILATPLEPIQIAGITILPFDGLHREKPLEADNGNSTPKPVGVPLIAYLIEFNHKRWLFPGDARTFDASRSPSLVPLDGVFAHLWLGRGCALLANPPMLEVFCQFYLDLKPDRIVVTHMDEFGRQAKDYWDEGHNRKVLRAFREKMPDLQVMATFMGDRVDL